MGKLIYKEQNFQSLNLKVSTGLASPYQNAGDTLSVILSKNLSALTVCDGVSNSASPSKSSSLLVDGINKYFKGKRVLNLEGYLSFLSKINLELLSKDLASTLSQIIVSKDQIFVFNFGDSQTILYNNEGEAIYESWPQNVGFSNESSNPSSHIIVNWIGNSHFRLELSIFDKETIQSGLIFSDGVLDLINPKEFELESLKVELTDNFSKVSDVNLLDDSSFIFIDFK